MEDASWPSMPSSPESPGKKLLTALTREKRVTVDITPIQRRLFSVLLKLFPDKVSYMDCSTFVKRSDVHFLRRGWMNCLAQNPANEDHILITFLNTILSSLFVFVIPLESPLDKELKDTLEELARILFRGSDPLTIAKPMSGSVYLPIPSLKLDHLFRLSDNTGIFQHARYTFPHREEGYCTDDVARALLVACWVDKEKEIVDSRISELVDVYISFLNHAFDDNYSRFKNFMSYGREWLEAYGSDDSHGRAVWALGCVIARTGRPDLCHWACDLFDRAVFKIGETTSLRTWCFGLLALNEFLRRFPEDQDKIEMRNDLAERMIKQLHSMEKLDWVWFEHILTYDNARLPQALISTGVKKYQEEGLRTLKWLKGIQTSPQGYFRPIGSTGFYPYQGERALFDQQPLEAAATVAAYLAAFSCTKDQEWLHAARVTFEWYLGKNDTSLPMYDESSGGCYDGLQPHSVNWNQGAESSLAYLMARADIIDALKDQNRVPEADIEKRQNGKSSLTNGVHA